MINLLISAYCVLAVDFYKCEEGLNQCINRHNWAKYEESMYTDVITEKMSQESFIECVNK